MSGFLLGYFFYPANEMDKVSQLESLIRLHYGKELPVLPHSLTAFDELAAPALFRTRSQTLASLVLAFPVEHDSDLPTLEGEMEQTVAPLKDDFLLGRTYVAAGFPHLHEVMALLQGTKAVPGGKSHQSLEFNFNQMKGLRHGLEWLDGLSFYVFPEANSRLLLAKLPVIEMKSRRSQLLWRYQRDQRGTIAAEREELERELSHVLYSNLMPATRHEQVEILEEDMNRLSRGYGVLTANHRLLIEGIGKLRDQTAALERELQDGGLQLDPRIIEVVMNPLQSELTRLQELVVELRDSRQNYQAGIDVVEGKVEMLLSRESLQLQQKVMQVLELGNSMQRQSLTLQVSASLIEFIILAYYGLTLWKYLDPTGYHSVPSWGHALLTTIFAGNVVYLTHLVAETIQGEEGLRGKTIIALVVLFLVIAVVIGAKSIFPGH